MRWTHGVGWLVCFGLFGCGGEDGSTAGPGNAGSAGTAGVGAGGGASGSGGGGGQAAGSGTGGGAGTAGGTAGTGAAGGSGGAPACAASCSGHGRCAVVDQAETCACDPFYYSVGLECLEDPCDGGSGRCFYVDSSGGVDGNDGSKANPWKTLARVKQAKLQPGDYVLLRRGREWTADDTYRISGIKGTETAPITYGAYGPQTEARPHLLGVRIEGGSENITLRDVEATGGTIGPCVAVEEASHVTIQNVEAHGCQNNGIRFGGQTEYGTMIDNLVYDVKNNDALSVHSPMVVTAETATRDHFWIADNTVPGNIGEQPVDVATGTDTVPGSRDVKIVGNVLGNGSNGCVSLGHGTSVVWVVGNIMGNCVSSDTAYGLGLGGEHKQNSGKSYRVNGNLLFWNMMSNIQSHGETPMTQEAWIYENTLVSGIGKRPAWRVNYSPAQFEFSRNIVWPTGSQKHVQLVSEADIQTMDDNWYVPESDPACKIHKSSLADWQASTGFDKNSSCAPVPGMSLPSQAEVDDVDKWTSDGFLDHFRPEANWPGCQAGVGAFDCGSGKLRVRFDAISGYSENGGLGWRGPLIVRQRYPLN